MIYPRNNSNSFKKLNELQETQKDNLIKSGKQYRKQNKKFNKEIEIINNQTEILDLKNTVKELKNAIESINIRKVKEKKESMR